MARNPSSSAPRPGELFIAEPWGLPPQGSSAEACSARDVVVENGLIVSCSLSGRAFISSARDLFRENPIRSLRLVAVAPFLKELANCERLAGLTRLDLDGNQIGPEGLKVLLASPFLANLRELGLGRNGLGPAGVESLIAWPGRATTRRLELQANGLSADDGERLFGCSEWPELSGLNLSQNALGPEFAECLTRLALTELEIEAVELGSAGATRLAKSGWKPLALNLGFNRLADSGVDGLLRSDFLSRCGKLDLRGNLIRIAEPFFDSSKLENLRWLDLRANPLDETTAENLRRRFGPRVLLA